MSDQWPRSEPVTVTYDHEPRPRYTAAQIAAMFGVPVRLIAPTRTQRLLAARRKGRPLRLPRRTRHLVDATTAVIAAFDRLPDPLKDARAASDGAPTR